MDFTKYENKIEYTKENKNAYSNEEQRLYYLFKRDALEETGILEHPKAEAAFALAWDKGHSCGYQEVYYELMGLADLLK